MKRIAFIDHSFHQKSLAFEFLKDILKKEYTIEEYWDYLSEGGKRIDANDLNSKDYDCIFFAQIFPDKALIDELKCKNIIWMPMYDSEVNSGLLRVIRILNKNVKILSFSKHQHDKYRSFGADSTYLQFFPQPLKELTNLENSSPTVYYWPRHEVISWEIVKKLLGEDFRGKVILQNVPDPKNSFIMPNNEDIERYKIEFISKWLDKDEAIKERAKADIFIAPRLYEGIGMAFLEAMSAGCAVVSPNNPTMNEYIVNKETGYLYDIRNPKPINFENLQKVKSNSYQYISGGYTTWTANCDQQIHEFIEKPYASRLKFLKYSYAFAILGVNKILKLVKKSV